MAYPTKITAGQAVTNMQTALTYILQQFIEDRDKVAAGDDPAVIMDAITQTVDARLADLDAWVIVAGFDDEGVRQYPDRVVALTVEYNDVRTALLECYTVQQTDQAAVLSYLDAVIATIEPPHA